jgi:hypothetical protein
VLHPTLNSCVLSCAVPFIYLPSTAFKPRQFKLCQLECEYEYKKSVCIYYACHVVMSSRLILPRLVSCRCCSAISGQIVPYLLYTIISYYLTLSHFNLIWTTDYAMLNFDGTESIRCDVIQSSPEPHLPVDTSPAVSRITLSSPVLSCTALLCRVLLCTVSKQSM